MHCICLTWVNSNFYSTPARIIVLLQELCNLFIQQVCIDDVNLWCDVIVVIYSSIEYLYCKLFTFFLLKNANIYFSQQDFLIIQLDYYLKLIEYFVGLKV